MTPSLPPVRVVDSHTEGEPTRVVLAGAPDLGSGSAAARAEVLAARFDTFRSFVCNEPRGFDALVGALWLPTTRPGVLGQVVFFNNVGLLGMCGHGTIGLAETLRHVGVVAEGAHVVETPVGDVTFTFEPDGRVAVRNVLSYPHARGVAVEVPGRGRVVGDVAWGGNWFFLAHQHGQELAADRIPALTDFAADLRAALERAGVTGAAGALIDHIELVGPPTRPDARARTFVLCPGREYDRSPCGTGTSAALACLAADGALAEGEEWGQESILGTVFHATFARAEGGVVPTVRGRAWVTAEATLLRRDDDPFRGGIRLRELAAAARRASAGEARRP